MHWNRTGPLVCLSLSSGIFLLFSLSPLPIALPYYQLIFLTACKSLRHLRVLAGTSDLKNPDLYYLCTVGPNGHSYASSLNILKSTFLGFDIIVLMKKVKKLYLYFLFFLKQGMAKCVEQLNRLISTINAKKMSLSVAIRQCQKGTIEELAWLPFPKKSHHNCIVIFNGFIFDSCNWKGQSRCRRGWRRSSNFLGCLENSIDQ